MLSVGHTTPRNLGAVSSPNQRFLYACSYPNLICFKIVVGCLFLNAFLCLYTNPRPGVCWFILGNCFTNKETGIGGLIFLCS